MAPRLAPSANRIPARESARTGLSQRRGEVEFLALVMHHVRSPEEPAGVAQAAVPVITEIVEDECEDQCVAGSTTGAQ